MVDLDRSINIASADDLLEVVNAMKANEANQVGIEPDGTKEAGGELEPNPKSHDFCIDTDSDSGFDSMSLSGVTTCSVVCDKLDVIRRGLARCEHEIEWIKSELMLIRKMINKKFGPNVRVFTETGKFTPTSSEIRVFAIGGGGGGGSIHSTYSGGGASGCVIFATLQVPIGIPIDVAVGDGGSGLYGMSDVVLRVMKSIGVFNGQKSQVGTLIARGGKCCAGSEVGAGVKSGDVAALCALFSTVVYQGETGNQLGGSGFGGGGLLLAGYDAPFNDATSGKGFGAGGGSGVYSQRGYSGAKGVVVIEW